jgi:ribose transport system permease protein
MKSVDAYGLTGQSNRSRMIPARVTSDLLGKRWMESAVPLSLALLISVAIVALVPMGAYDFVTIGYEVAIKGLMAVGLTIVLISGGIDLSVGAIMGVAALTVLTLHRVFNVPMVFVLMAGILVGLLLGAVNGVFIAVFKTRPFITTLVTLILFRGVATWIQTTFGFELGFAKESIVWDFLGRGTIAGIPITWLIFIIVLVAAHLAVTRSRWGWHLTAVGTDRRSARRNGIKIDRAVLSTYVLSGGLAGLAGILTTARLGRADAAVGSGTELVVLTAVVLGGVSLAGGRGSVIRAVVGMLVVAAIQQATLVLHSPDGYFPTLLAIALVVFAVLDIKWGKNRSRLSEKLLLNPATVPVGPLIDVSVPGSKWSINRALTDAPPMGIGQIEGAEDCAIDSDGSVYCGDRRGWIWHFPSEEGAPGSVFARTGGHPLGHAWERDGSLVVAVGGTGVVRVHPDKSVELVANRVRRTFGSIRDDSPMTFADDLDVTPDGAIYVSDFSTRTNLSEYMNEFVESRPNGRVVRIDPDGTTEVVVRNYLFPNGICTSHDGQSILIASSGLFRIDRLYVSGTKQGQIEPVLENLPGYPDNINRASDGNYWMAFLAMRTPMSDLLLKHPAARVRMTKQLASDDWIVPQLNVSCVVKFTESGEILKVLWDATLEKYPMVTSMKESDGQLFLCGIHNNRVGRLQLAEDDIGPIDTRFVLPQSTGRALESVK